MKTEQWLSTRRLVAKILPRGNRRDYIDGLEGKQKQGSLTRRETASTIARVHWDHAVGAFNRWGYFLQMIVVIFCFGASVLPWQMAILIGANLLAVTLREAWTYRDVRLMDSLTDGVVTCVFMLASLALAGKASPSMPLPVADLYRGSVICLPLIVILRKALRTKPDGPPISPFETLKMTARQIYWRTWGLNILWVITFWGLVAQNVSDRPDYFPDKIRGAVIILFGAWLFIQTDGLLLRRLLKRFLFKVRKTELERMYGNLPKGFVKGEPGYWLCIIAQDALYLVMATSLVEALWLWRSGNPSQADMFRAIGSMVAFATALLSWNYVKEANRAAARAILAEINRPH